MGDFLGDKLQGVVFTIVGALLLTWLTWISGSLITIQQRMVSIELNQANVIPPVVEASLRELREKTNSQAAQEAQTIAKLTETAINNAKDIGYLREQVSRKP